MMTYDDAILYIHGCRRFSAAPSLVRIKTLLNALENPEKRLKFVHIAGTNGKGSTAAMTASIMQEAGYKTGLFTSPYLECFRERIQINGEMISETALAGITGRVREKVDEIIESGCETVNEFELVTAIGLCYFEEQNCDLVVLETGLGGRYDATNAIPPPLVAAITSIGIDHVAQLGDAIPKIAFEKSGIIKKGSAVVISPDQKPEALSVLIEACDEIGVKYYIPDWNSYKLIRCDLSGLEITYDNLLYFVPLMGHHQAANILTSLFICKILGGCGFSIFDEAIRAGFSNVRWPGRLELICKKPMILLDTAHNTGGMECLCHALDTIFAGKRVAAIMGMMEDKQWRQCVSMIAPRCKRFIAVSADAPRCLNPDILLKAAEGLCDNIQSYASLETALRQETLKQEDEELLLICGSVALVGRARGILLQHLALGIN